MMNYQKLFRQGDVLIRAIPSLPSAELEKQKDGILAHGEVTGHAHRIADLAAAQLFVCGDGMFLTVGEGGVAIVHEEHGAIDLAPGAYEVIRQREYSPEEIRNVAD